MDNQLNVTLKNLAVAKDVTIEELNISISFKCEPEVAEKWMELLTSVIAKIQ
jgi:hypothetical protein